MYLHKYILKVICEMKERKYGFKVLTKKITQKHKEKFEYENRIVVG